MKKTKYKNKKKMNMKRINSILIVRNLFMN